MEGESDIFPARTAILMLCSSITKKTSFQFDQRLFTCLAEELQNRRAKRSKNRLLPIGIRD
jgi:hypothetical protein